jgi:two-component sensor histidine kinase
MKQIFIRTVLIVLVSFPESSIAQSHIEIGQDLLNQSKYDQAHSYFDSLLTSCNNNCDEITHAKYQLYLGKTKHFLEFYTESLDLIQKSIKTFRKRKDYNNLVLGLTNLAELYRKIDNEIEGLKIIREATRIAEKYPVSNSNKAYLYNRYSPLCTFDPGPDSTVYYCQKSLNYSRKINDQDLIASSLNELGFFHYKRGPYDKSEAYFTEALELEKKLGTPIDIAGVLINLTRLYEIQGQFSKGLPIIEEALLILEETKWTNVKCEAYKLQSKCLFGLGQFAKSREIYDKYVEAVLQIRKDQWSESLVDAEARYELNNKERRLKEERKKRKEESKLQEEKRGRLMIYIALAAIILFGILLLLVRERRLKFKMENSNKKLATTNEKYEMLVTESNHRIKNNLQMIISMLDYTGQDVSKEGSKALENISGKIQTISALHRHLHFDIHNEKVSVHTYFSEIIEHYRQINTLPMVIKLEVQEIEINSERIIYFGLILNELLSNSIEHSNSVKGEISIAIAKDGEAFQFRYADGSQLPEDIVESTGIQLVKELVARVEGIEFTMKKEVGRYQFTFHV